MRSTAVAPALLALTLLVSAAGCSGEPADDGEPSAAAESTTPSTPSSTPSSTPTTQGPTATPSTRPEASASPFAADTRPDDGGRGSGNGLGLTRVRVAQQPGFDRVVFDLSGTGTPGWRVEYTTDPRAEGSGEPVTLQGTTYLQVVLRGVGMPFDTGVPAFGDDSTRVPGTGTKGVAEIAPGGVFEGEQLAFIGLTGATRPFRAFALTDPTRVVVDVRHD